MISKIHFQTAEVRPAETFLSRNHPQETESVEKIAINKSSFRMFLLKKQAQLQAKNLRIAARV